MSSLDEDDANVLTRAPGPAAGIGTVDLVARDVTRMTAFYRDVVGLEVLERTGGVVWLGAGGRTLLRLISDPAAAPDDPRMAGLFHTAFLLPGRADLGAWVNRAAEIGLEIEGASDHIVSEALYLADPEGNGIEIYADRPRETWAWSDGQVEMATMPLDLEALASSARGLWQGAPDGTIVGHLHLRVGSAAEAERFYGEVLGLDVTNKTYPAARFFAVDRYHHHVGANEWRSRGAGRRPAGMAGLGAFDLVLEPEAHRRAVERAGGEEVEDPWGLRVRLLAAA